jgi:hypothetical protein
MQVMPQVDRLSTRARTAVEELAAILRHAIEDGCISDAERARLVPAMGEALHFTAKTDDALGYVMALMKGGEDATSARRHRTSFEGHYGEPVRLHVHLHTKRRRDRATDPDAA